MHSPGAPTPPPPAPAAESPRQESRWPALFAIVIAGILYAALPDDLAVGPRWLLLALVAAVELPAMLSHWRGYDRLNKTLGIVASALITAFLLWSLALLVANLPNHKQPPADMLRSAGVLWLSNILVFALWYWRLDAGGPHGRDRRPGHTEGGFLFPQMTLESVRGKWSPQFVDYLFLSFTTSTALSPTDTPTLGRWAKILIMLQAIISLSTIALLAARAVNIM